MPVDIALFDFALILAGDDVPVEVINNAHKEKVPHKYK